ncbi:uncharacterized protein VTP21DRAFT_8018 [Calcarisporiella thermophila]|uniref:uncharacterized protein n=1 Tax=Calcarisporiella thermophila TaxID=911321 RepID=UPI003742D22B
MSHCHDEHHSHSHDHDHIPDDAGAKDNLYGRIDREHVSCLNEAVPGSGKKVIKPWHERMDNEQFVESDSDEQLIFFIPFTGNVKLRSICIRAGPGEAAPSKMKAFINREDVDFDVADTYDPVQEWELVQNTDEVAEYPTRLTKFTSVRNLTLYFPENFGADATRVLFIGLRGEWSEIKKDPIITIYEAQANPADHKTPAGEDRMHRAID